MKLNFGYGSKLSTYIRLLDPKNAYSVKITCIINIFTINFPYHLVFVFC